MGFPLHESTCDCRESAAQNCWMAFSKSDPSVVDFY
jgi:hypothetical protein